MMKKQRNSYLLVDYGNTNIKVGIYDVKTSKVNEIHFINNKQPFSTVLKQFKTLKNCKIVKAFVSATVSSSKSNAVMKYIHNTFKADTKLITMNDFKGLLDLTNVSKDVGIDLLLLGLYASLIKPKCAIICLGTVYTAIIMNGNKFESVLLIPSLKYEIENIPNRTSISSKFIPTKYDKNIGLNTKDCFAAGANLSIEGLVDNIAKKHNIKSSNIFITGGDSDKYLNINKKYKVIDNLTLKAISLLL